MLSPNYYGVKGQQARETLCRKALWVVLITGRSHIARYGQAVYIAKLIEIVWKGAAAERFVAAPFRF